MEDKTELERLIDGEYELVVDSARCDARMAVANFENSTQIGALYHALADVIKQPLLDQGVSGERCSAFWNDTCAQLYDAIEEILGRRRELISGPKEEAA